VMRDRTGQVFYLFWRFLFSLVIQAHVSIIVRTVRMLYMPLRLNR
jgi:hypothetical protein